MKEQFLITIYKNYFQKHFSNEIYCFFFLYNGNRNVKFIDIRTKSCSYSNYDSPYFHLIFIFIPTYQYIYFLRAFSCNVEACLTCCRHHLEGRKPNWLCFSAWLRAWFSFNPLQGNTECEAPTTLRQKWACFLVLSPSLWRESLDLDPISCPFESLFPWLWYVMRKALNLGHALCKGPWLMVGWTPHTHRRFQC